MKSLYWIKSWIDRLDDPRFGTMPDWLFRRFIELELVAGENNQGGLLPPVTRMAWRLRLDETKLSEALTSLKAVGVVHQDEAEHWWISDFGETQARASDAERSKRHRARQKDEKESVTYRDENVTNAVTKRDENVTKCVTSSSHDSSLSSSSSPLSSDIAFNLKSLNALYESWDWRPTNPKDALSHPALAAFERACGGIPGERDYEKAVQWVRLIGKRYQLQPSELDEYLKRYADWWRGQIGKNGQPYDPLNINWLLRAYNGESLEPKIVAPPAGTNGQIKTTGVLDKLSREIEAKNKRQL